MDIQHGRLVEFAGLSGAERSGLRDDDVMFKNFSDGAGANAQPRLGFASVNEGDGVIEADVIGHDRFPRKSSFPLFPLVYFNYSIPDEEVKWNCGNRVESCEIKPSLNSTGGGFV